MSRRSQARRAGRRAGGRTGRARSPRAGVARDDVAHDPVKAGREDRAARSRRARRDGPGARARASRHESTPIAAIAVPRIPSESISTSRRSKRSLTAPPTSSRSTCGAIQATPTTPSAVGAFEAHRPARRSQRCRGRRRGTRRSFRSTATQSPGSRSGRRIRTRFNWTSAVATWLRASVARWRETSTGPPKKAARERVRDPLELAAALGDDVEPGHAGRVLADARRARPWPRGAAAHLLVGHHLERVSEGGAGLPLHLAEDERTASPDDEVELVAADPDVRTEDAIAADAIVRQRPPLGLRACAPRAPGGPGGAEPEPEQAR